MTILWIVLWALSTFITAGIAYLIGNVYGAKRAMKLIMTRMQDDLVKMFTQNVTQHKIQKEDSES